MNTISNKNNKQMKLKKNKVYKLKPLYQNKLIKPKIQMSNKKIFFIFYLILQIINF